MESAASHDITALLRAWSQGDEGALLRLIDANKINWGAWCLSGLVERDQASESVEKAPQERSNALAHNHFSPTRGWFRSNSRCYALLHRTGLGK